jgi:hypothetical protein
MTTFTEVKKILEDAIIAFTAQNGAPDLTGAHTHNSPSFGWGTRAQLLGSEVVRGGKSYMLIDPAHIGNGQGAETNLVVALREGVSGFPRMPAGGPFIDDALVQKIVDWIDARCPE